MSDFPEFSSFPVSTVICGNDRMMQEKDNYYYLGRYANMALCIEAAWTAVNALGGGMVLVEEGDFGDMSAQIDSQGGDVILCGMGYGSYLRTSGANHVISIDGHSYVTIRDIRLAQQSSGNNNNCVMINNDANYIRIEGCYITDSDRYGIESDGSIPNPDYIWIMDCYFTGCDNMGMKLDATVGDITYIIIAGCIFNNVAGMYSVSLEHALQCIIIGCIATGGYNAFDFGVGVYRSVMVGNVAYDPSNYGFYVAWFSHQNVVTGNVAYSTGSDGIYVGENDYIVITGNLIYDPVGSGVEFDDADYCMCIGNTVYSSGAGSIIFGAGTTQNMLILVGNLTVDSASTGITVADDIIQVLVSSNMIYNPTNQGIYIGDLAAHVVGNYIYSAGDRSIQVFNGDDLFIAGNYIYDGASYGIWFQGGVHDSAIIGNYIYSCTWGVYIDADSDDNVISHNWTRSNSSGCLNIANANCDTNKIYFNNFDEGNITDAGTGTVAFDNFDPSAGGWIATIAPPAGGR